MRKKILVLEKEPFIFMLLRMHSKGFIYDLITASDGAVGLKKIDSEKPDLILLDVVLDTISGFEFVQELRSRTDETRLIPVLIFSDRPSIKNLFLPKDIQGFIQEPFIVLDLLDTIQRVIKESETIRGTVPKALIVGLHWEAIRPIKDVLEERGFEAVVAQDAHHALQAAITKHPSVIFVASILAGMDIWEFCRAVKDFPLLADTPLVVYDVGGMFQNSNNTTLGSVSVIVYNTHAELQEQTKAFIRDHF